MSSARALALTPLPRGVTLAVSGVILSGVVLTARSVAMLSPVTPHPLLTTTAATLDLTVTASLLAWWMLARDLGWSARALVALFLASLMLAGVVLPADQEGPLRAMHLAVAPLELVLMAWLLRKVARTRRRVRARPAGAGHLDVQDAILLATADVVGAGRFAEILADEMSVLFYALARHPGDRATQDAAGTPHAEHAGTAAGPSDSPPLPSFTYHHKTAYGAVVFALVLATLGEIPAMHLLVRLWSDRAAWILTALGLYAILWIIGDWRASRLRPIRVENGTLRIRFGLRWRADVPLDSILRVRPSTASERATKGAVDLRLALPGGSWTVLELDRPVVAVGMYGRRRTVRSLGLGVDEPARLAAVLAPVEASVG
jgi:hypothetical protein